MKLSAKKEESLLKKIATTLLVLGVFYTVFTPHKVESSTTVYDQEFKFLQPDYQVAQTLYENWKLQQKAESLKGKYGGQCVTFARKFTGATPNNVGGVARNVPTNSDTPQVGEIVKTKESKYGHLAVVIDVTDTTITVVESNYHFNERVGIREIEINDPKIVGYITIN